MHTPSIRDYGRYECSPQLREANAIAMKNAEIERARKNFDDEVFYARQFAKLAGEFGLDIKVDIPEPHIDYSFAQEKVETVTEPKKKCRICHKSLPIADFRPGSNGAYHSVCIDCEDRQNEIRRRNRKSRIMDECASMTEKTCSICGETKDIAEYYMIDRFRIFPYCKACHKAKKMKK